MYEYRTVVNGILEFIDKDLLPKMSGLQKWLFGTGAGIMANKSEHLFEELKHNSLIKTLGLIEDSKVDVTCIYKELLKQAEHGAIHIEIPMLGTVTLDRSDVDKIYRYIIED
jgi:hypothetical protein